MQRVVASVFWRHATLSRPAFCYNSCRNISFFGQNDKTSPTTPEISIQEVPLEDKATVLNPEAVADALSGYLPPPPIPEPKLTTAEDGVGPFVGEVRLHDLGLGNCYWKPNNWIQSGLDILHFDFHLPWWQAIMTGTIFVRICMFPLVIRAQRFMAQYANNMPTIIRLQQRISAAVASNNPLETERMSKEYTDYLRRNNLLSFRQYAPMLAQGFIFMSVFTGLRAMATLPVDSMRTGGVAWFTDLTAVDPFYLLPILTSATLFVTIRMGADGISPSSMPVKWMRTGFQLMPIFILPLTAFFPSAMCLYWFTSNTFSFMQVAFLRQPKVREYLGIPAIVKHDPKVLEEQQQSMRNNFNQMRAAFKQQSALARARDHQQLEQKVRQEQLQKVLEKETESKRKQLLEKTTPKYPSDKSKQE